MVLPKPPDATYASVSENARTLLDGFFAAVLKVGKTRALLPFPPNLSEEEIKKALIGLLDKGLILFIKQGDIIQLAIWNIENGGYRVVADVCKLPA